MLFHDLWRDGMKTYLVVCFFAVTYTKFCLGHVDWYCEQNAKMLLLDVG
jgi:hypothetical protein